MRDADIVSRLRLLPEPQCRPCLAAADEIERLRAEVEELRKHQCLWGNDPSGPYFSDEYLASIDPAVTKPNDATGHQ